MTQWEVVLVVIALFGFVSAVVAPVVKLTSSVTRLTTIVDAMEKNFSEMTKDNRDAHKRIWDHNTEQDAVITKHEMRIGILEEHEKTA